MYAVAVSILFQDGKLDELKEFFENTGFPALEILKGCLLYTSPSPRDY